MIFVILHQTTLAASAPQITTLSPASGSVGTSVTISGTSFGSTQGSSTVKFNGTTATPTSWSATSIVAPVPSGATNGNVVVTVGGAASNAVSFTVTASQAPTILLGDSNIESTVDYNALGQAQAWPYTASATGTVSTLSFYADSSTGNGPYIEGIYADAGGAPGALLASGSMATTAASKWNTVTLSTTVNVTAGVKYWLALLGVSGNMVRFHDDGAACNSAGSNTGLKALPAIWTTSATWQNCPASIYASGTTGAGNPAPSISGLTPASGIVGTSVTISGTNFGSTGTVTFNGTSVTVTSWSASSVVVTVPTAATSGNVVVTVGGVASNGVPFTVTPNITSLSPTAGAVGTSVTISGTSFGSTQGSSTVKFNTTAATPTSWSATSIVVSVPSGASTGNVVVTVGGAASNGVTFSVGLAVTVSPKRAALTITQAVPLTATVSNDGTNQGVKWAATGGSFYAGTSASGVAVTYTAPATAGVYTITATSVADSGASASTTIAVTDLEGVYTYHDDLARDGANSQEYSLSPSTVSTSTFGKLFSCTVDGAIYAQPLWVANLSVNGGIHNVVFVATQHESLYAFDADSSPCVTLWHVNLIDTNHGGTAGETPVPSGPSGNLVGSGYGDITPEVGVTGTPVIDPAPANTLYVVSKSVSSGGTTFYQRLHAIDLATGNEKYTKPANITSSITFPGTGDGGSTVSFNTQQQNQRAGLALVNGVVYVAWASHEDRAPYYGWIVGFNASTLAVSSILNVSPNAQYSGIWMGGGAPSADGNNNIYLITGNGTFDVTNASSPNNDYGDSFLQLSGNLAVSSYFTPSDQANDNANDVDFGSGGAAVVLNLSSGTLKHLVVGGGKDGTVYLLNGDSMGGLGDSQARQHFNIGTQIHAIGAFWNNNLYIAASNAPLLSYSFNSSTDLFNTSFASESAINYGWPGPSPSVSATGSSNGIVWALDDSNYCTPQSTGCGPAVLHAYNAANLGVELWNSSLSGGDAAGNAVKFTIPTIANGKVYIGTRGNNTGGIFGSTTISGELDVYGLKQN